MRRAGGSRSAWRCDRAGRHSPKAVYPVLFDPRTLLLCLHKSCDSAATQIAEKLFSFTNPMESTAAIRIRVIV